MHKLVALPYNPPPAGSAWVNREPHALEHELGSIGKNSNDRLQVNVEAGVDTALPEDYPVDASEASITKTNYGYLVENTATTQGNYTYSGGTYIPAGSWERPVPSAVMACQPLLDMSRKKLKLQSFYIRFGCGRELARELMAHMHMALMQQFF